VLVNGPETLFETRLGKVGSAMLFGHHAEGFLEIEILGHPFPDGPTEHALAVGLAAAAGLLMSYGAYALVRDLLCWRRSQAVQPSPPRSIQ
jgi:hypothetical protein